MRSKAHASTIVPASLSRAIESKREAHALAAHLPSDWLKPVRPSAFVAAYAVWRPSRVMRSVEMNTRNDKCLSCLAMARGAPVEHSPR